MLFMFAVSTAAKDWVPSVERNPCSTARNFSFKWAISSSRLNRCSMTLLISAWSSRMVSPCSATLFLNFSTSSMLCDRSFLKSSVDSSCPANLARSSSIPLERSASVPSCAATTLSLSLITFSSLASSSTCAFLAARVIFASSPLRSAAFFLEAIRSSLRATSSLSLLSILLESGGCELGAENRGASIEILGFPFEPRDFRFTFVLKL